MVTTNILGDQLNARFSSLQIFRQHTVAANFERDVKVILYGKKVVLVES